MHTHAESNSYLMELLTNALLSSQHMHIIHLICFSLYLALGLSLSSTHMLTVISEFRSDHECDRLGQDLYLTLSIAASALLTYHKDC